MGSACGIDIFNIGITVLKELIVLHVNRNRLLHLLRVSQHVKLFLSFFCFFSKCISSLTFVALYLHICLFTLHHPL